MPQWVLEYSLPRRIDIDYLQLQAFSKNVDESEQQNHENTCLGLTFLSTTGRQPIQLNDPLCCCSQVYT